MSVMTDLLQRFGLTGAIGTTIARLESVLILVHRIPTMGGARYWHSQSGAREFQNMDLARKAINESYSRLPVAR